MANTYTNLLYHIVFSTKNRMPMIFPELEKNLYAYIGGIIRGENGTLIQIGGTSDHIHIAAKFRTSLSIADMLRLIKSNSSKWMNEQHQNKDKFAWQDGYGAFTVSESQLSQVVDYIRNQKEHHRRKAFQEEYLDLLKLNKIEYDEKYLWS